jgi:hypothetical protein
MLLMPIPPIRLPVLGGGAILNELFPVDCDAILNEFPRFGGGAMLNDEYGFCCC